MPGLLAARCMLLSQSGSTMVAAELIMTTDENFVGKSVTPSNPPTAESMA